jgi:hypothetical protein
MKENALVKIPAKNHVRAIAPLALLLAAACASKPVNMSEPRRLVGTENDVRIDAEIIGEQLSPAARLPIKYDITNNRTTAIAVAELIPETTYDPETQTVTVSLGSEVPGFNVLPRLTLIPAGEKRSFSSNANVKIVMPVGPNPFMRFPNAMRVKLNFLGDPQPFAQLIDIPERAVADPKLAAEIFPKWVEGNESVYTNVLPMRWSGNVPMDDAATPAEAPRRRRRP